MSKGFEPYEKRVDLIEPGEVVVTFGGAFEVMCASDTAEGPRGGYLFHNPRHTQALEVPPGSMLDVVAHFDIEAARRG